MRAHGVIADTHALIWYVDSPSDLSAGATNALDNAANDVTQRIYISAISLIEMQYLTEKGKIKPTVLPKVLAEIDDPQPIIEVVPIDRAVAVRILLFDLFEGHNLSPPASGLIAIEIR